jgi:hypothetical protein
MASNILQKSLLTNPYFQLLAARFSIELFRTTLAPFYIIHLDYTWRQLTIGTSYQLWFSRQHQIISFFTTLLEQDMSFSLSGRDGNSNRLHQLGKARIKHPRELARPAESPFTLFGDKFGPFRKTHGPASSQDMPVQLIARSKQGLGWVPFFQTLRPAMLAVQYLP